MGSCKGGLKKQNKTKQRMFFPPMWVMSVYFKNETMGALISLRVFLLVSRTQSDFSESVSLVPSGLPSLTHSLCLGYKFCRGKQKAK